MYSATTISLFVILNCSSLVYSIEITTTFGKLIGTNLSLTNGTLYTFYNIPYATSRVFEKPQSIIQWVNFLHDGTKQLGNCEDIMDMKPPLSPRENMLINAESNCLTMTIIMPAVSFSSSLPILFCIDDSSFFENGKKIAESGIVVVLVNHRKGLNGFFSLGNQFVPGNLALWDLKSALSPYPGGIGNLSGMENTGTFFHLAPSLNASSNQITIGGIGNGAMMVSAMVHSKECKGLFQQAIAISGSIHSILSTSENVVNNSLSLSSLLSCRSGPISEVKKCMKVKTITQMREAIRRVTSPFPSWHPRLDGQFLNQLDEVTPTTVIYGIIEGRCDFSVVSKEIINFYEKEVIETERTITDQIAIDLNTVVPLIHELEEVKKKNVKTFLFSVDSSSADRWIEEFTGNLESFVKSGDPSTQMIKWEQSGMELMNIRFADKITEKIGYRPEMLQLWRSMEEKYGIRGYIDSAKDMQSSLLPSPLLSPTSLSPSASTALSSSTQSTQEKLKENSATSSIFIILFALHFLYFL